MHDRPLSDRRPHAHGELPWEVRVWVEPPGSIPEQRGWRSIAWTDEHDDAVAVALAMTTGPTPATEFAEVCGPGRACERFPQPDADERRAMWLRAVSTLYNDGVR
jgi:hypothetical protein